MNLSPSTTDAHDVIELSPTTLLAERSVSMSNALARAAQNLDLNEKRLIAIGLAKTDSMSLQGLALAANAGWKLTLNAQEYADEFGVTTSTAYKQLRSACEHLYERSIGFVVPGKAKGSGKKADTVRRWRWVSAVEYSEGEGYVQLNFSPEIAPHLLGLRHRFTSYKLKQAARFDTVYAWRLYELLKSWSDTGRWSPTVEEFNEIMETPPSFRADFKALRVRCIEPSVEALNAKAGLVVSWKPLRYGARKVSALEFVFAPVAQSDLFGPEAPEDLSVIVSAEDLLGPAEASVSSDPRGQS